LVTVRELAGEIAASQARPVSLTCTGQYRVGDIRSCFADLTRSRNILGYEPEVRFTSGVAELLDWARGESLEDRHDVAEAALRERKLI
jgi:dTDP-L-rhamnose 4-epimerase